jgi:prolyl-tRNA synthetase
MSQLFIQTLRDIPSEADVVSHGLLLRAGYIRQLASGIFSELPLGKRSITKIENILREEMDKIGGQEISMPVVHPGDIWKETERWYQVGQEMGRFKDRNDRDMVLAMTHEEVIADLVRKDIRTYRQLPRLLYHIKTKWRDEARPRAGLIRVREFTMKDSYSLDKDWEGLDVQYRDHYQAYFNIFNRCGLPVISVKSDVGMMGGQMAHEFMYLSEIGEDTIIFCDECQYSANRQVARFKKIPGEKEVPQEIEKVETPGVKTIESLADFLTIPLTKTAKAVLFYAEFADENQPDKLIFALTRGDFEVNETKITNAVNAKELRPATEEEISRCGVVPGYASPLGIKNAIVVIDDIITETTNMVVGANEENYHLKNVNYDRDFKPDIIADISSAKKGYACPECDAPLNSNRGIEVGNIFKLGSRYSESMGCKFLDPNGEEKFVIMGSYGIGSGRLLQCIAEERNDQNGLIWPISVAPYQVHLIVIPGKDDVHNIREKADRVYHELQNAGIEVHFDDRDESPGIKFNDSDLIGLPIRLTISNKSIKNGGVELKLRREKNYSFVSFDELNQLVKDKIHLLFKELNDAAVTIPFPE